MPSVKYVMAYACLAVGVAGVALPVLPGVPFLIAGFKLLGPDHPLTRRFVDIVKKRSR